MSNVDFLTYEEAKRLFSYNPETGDIIRLKDGNKKWSVAGNKSFVVTIPVGKKYRQIAATRLAFLLMTGELPIYPIHCKDCNRQNLKWENLMEGKPGVLVPSKKSGTGVRGLYKKGNSYVISTAFDNIPIRLSSKEHSLHEMQNIMKYKKLSVYNSLKSKITDQELARITK